jgi:hypothetical protein
LFQGIPHADIPLPDNPSERKEWHKAITNYQRQHLIQKLVRTIFPSPDPAATEDPRVKDLISYAKKVERDMFEIANDKEMYYFLLAEKIYTIQKELQGKKNRRLNEQQNRCQDPGIPPPGTRQMVLQQQQYTFHQVKQPVQGTMFISEANGVPPRKVVLNEPPAVAISGVKREIKQEQQNLVYNSESSISAPSPSNKKRKLDEAQASLAVEEIIPDPKVFDANELRSFLQPILDKIVRLKDAVIFREPVDPVLNRAKVIFYITEFVIY